MDGDSGAVGARRGGAGEAPGDRPPERAAGRADVLPGREAGAAGVFPGRVVGSPDVVPGRPGEVRGQPGPPAEAAGDEPGRAPGAAYVLPGRAPGAADTSPGQGAECVGVLLSQEAECADVLPGQGAGRAGVLPGQEAECGDVLPGRAGEEALLRAALTGIRDAGAAVLLRGDPGLGKSALLDRAARCAERAGLRVLRMAGVVAEAACPFAALHQLLWPLLDDLRAVPAPERELLERALGLRDGTPPAPADAAPATLGLLARAAAARPLVLLLDDLQWADPESAFVFTAVRRHLATAPAASSGPGTSAVPGTPVVPEAPAMPEAPAIPEVSVAPAQPAAPKEPAAPLGPAALRPLVAPTQPTARAPLTPPTEPTAPTEPTEPTEPITPAALTEPAVPTTPRAPITPEAPTAASAPTEPTAPSTSAALTEPAEPTTPRAPTETSALTAVSAPTEPTAPSTPAALTEPAEPTTPITPGAPTEASAPTEPATPAKPEATPTLTSPKAPPAPTPPPAVVLTATRHEHAPAASPAEHVLDLGPLPDDVAGRLLDALHPDLDAPARRRVLRLAGGNPLALRELPRALRRAGDFADPESTGPLAVPQLGPRLGGLYEDRVRALPDAARQALLLAALGGPDAADEDTLAGLTRRSGSAPWGVRAQDVERSGLVRLDPESRRLLFRHPLVRAGVVHLATAAERRAAHRLLADALPPHDTRRALHLAAATIGFDDPLARRLHEQADLLAEAADEAGAATLMARAAGLTTDGPARASRLVRAAGLAARGGRLRFAAHLLDQAEHTAGAARPEPAALYALVVAYIRFQREGTPEPALHLLPEALDLLRAPGREEQCATLLEPILFVLLVVAAHAGDERAWQAVDRHAPDATAPTALCRAAWTATPDDPADLPRRVSTAVTALPEAHDPATFRALVWAASAVDTVGDHAARWHRAAPRHSYATRTLAELAGAQDGFLRGDWDTVLGDARRGAGTAAARGYAFHEMMFLMHTAQVLAGRGDRAGLQECLRVLEPWAEERRLRAVGDRLRGLKALCALAHRAPGEAWQHVRTSVTPAALARRTPWSHLSLLDIAQAAADTGHLDEARDHLRAVHAAGLARVSPHHAFLVAAAGALLADDADEGPYEAAYAVPGARQWPFELARLRLAHGARLRRRSRRTEAVAHLRAAREVFTGLRAEPWAGQAACELGAAGAGVPEAGAARGHPLLSVQESRIADLAAQGLSNREIGERLRLSPRTVGAHLYRVFPKLGISTRAGIARALAETRGRREPDAGG
ncbi:AAA family ATPase [Streptomyces longispororuber]|uniref:helix-turn-helix transcriptional regulator n=1 Tax=Streptomyces longispororuber TaxID=68230 RepID=UPI0036FA9393